MFLPYKLGFVYLIILICLLARIIGFIPKKVEAIKEKKLGR
jgi:hypothetical protein